MKIEPRQITVRELTDGYTQRRRRRCARLRR